MDILDEDLLKFWKSLNSHNVQYIMVGGYAMTFHGHQRLEGVMEIWVDVNSENFEKLKWGLNEMDITDISALDTLKVSLIPTTFRFNSGLRLDMLTAMKGLESFSFDECLRIASIADINSIKVPFLHINQLITNKKAVNRSKDQIDVIELEKIKILRKEMGLD